MKKSVKLLCLSPLLLVAAGGLTSCSQSDNTLYLRVINSEDYIYLNEGDPEELPDLTVQFEQSDAVKTFLEGCEAKYGKKYSDVKVIYDTSDTNETLYSELQTGKTNYDLMNVSDYMAQKIVSGKMAVPLYRHNGASYSDAPDYDMIPNYQQYASADIKQRLDDIVAVQKIFNKETKKVEPQDRLLKEYSVGYMWGTLGILFNPTYGDFGNIGEEQVINDMQDFGTLWNSKYKGTISIKNSMRDTYALGVMQTYRDDFKSYRDEYLQAVEDAGTDEEKIAQALATYQEKFALKFNSSSQGDVEKVRKTLEALKNNIFGLEVDSGKQDIITKKIGVNLAWSGDAVYSMDQGEDLTQVTSEVELYYSVPELGSNLWFDTWIMPNCSRSDAQYDLAHLFLNFLCDPVNAAQNMNYTGYTSFIGGDSILELVRDWYDYRTEEIYVDEEYSVYSLNETTHEVLEIGYDDFLADREASRDNDKLYYYMPTGEEPEGYEVTESDLLNEDTGAPVMIEEEGGTERQKLYSDLTIVDATDSELEAVDLSYFFNNTLDEYVDNVDTIFYSDCYLPFNKLDENGEALLDSDNNPIQNISVGRQFFCQYPNKETLDRCAVMADYGENNQYVMKMWENFKSNPLPTWAIVTFITILVIGLGFVALLIVNSVLKKNIKNKRIKN